MVRFLFNLFKRNQESRDQNQSKLGYEHYKHYVFLLLSRIVTAYSVMPLSWWHALISFIGGVFFGLFAGFLITSYAIPPTPKKIIVPVNRTHIIEVELP